MVARPAEDEAFRRCLATLEASLGDPSSRVHSLAGFSAETVEAALDALARRLGEAALPLLTAVAEGAPTKAARKSARRALYRLAQTGIAAPPRPARPVLERGPERLARAWLSGIDGTGSRAVWILFEGGFGDLALCALVLNDQVGVLESAGGTISRKRLEAELRSLRQGQPLPWLEVRPERAAAVVAEALAIHARLGTEPPLEFSRWRERLEASAGTPTAPITDVPGPGEAAADPTLLDHSAELLELPELAGWFVDPALIQREALELLEAQESRLVLSDQLKAEREAGIADRVVDRAFTPEGRETWARRLVEMAWIFHATERPRDAVRAYATALALRDRERIPHHLPFARALAQRGLALAAEVTLGRLGAALVSRAPRR
jgi:hypothetical protein